MPDSDLTDERAGDIERDDSAETAPADAGHSDADSQAQRNTDDESPS
jgi:hypothetical protein